MYGDFLSHGGSTLVTMVVSILIHGQMKPPSGGNHREMEDHQRANVVN